MDNLITLKEARDLLAAQVETLRGELDTLRKSRQTVAGEMNVHQKTMQDTLAGLNSGMSIAEKNQAQAALLAARNSKNTKQAEMDAIGPTIQAKREALNTKEQELSDAEIAYQAALAALA